MAAAVVRRGKALCASPRVPGGGGGHRDCGQHGVVGAVGVDLVAQLVREPEGVLLLGSAEAHVGRPAALAAACTPALNGSAVEPWGSCTGNLSAAGNCRNVNLGELT